MDNEYALDSCNPEEFPRTMKAVVLKGKGFANLAVAQVPIPKIGDNQLLCRVDAAGVCTSLLKIIAQGGEHSLLHGWDPAIHPIILGDEGALTVMRAGKNLAKEFPRGKRFGLQPSIELKPILHRKWYRNNAKEMHKCAVGYTVGGCLAQYLLIQEEVLAGGCLVPLPDDSLPHFAVALAEPVSCVYSAQKRHVHLVKQGSGDPARIQTGILPGGVTLIIGAGLMGRINCEMAMRFQPRHLVIADTDLQRLAVVQRTLAGKAKEKGIIFKAVPADQLKSYLKKTEKQGGADDVITAVGLHAVQQAAFSLLNPGGVLDLFGGLTKPDHTLQVDARQVHYEEIKIMGSSGGDPADLAASLKAIADHDLDPGNFVAAVGSLGHTAQALKMIQEQKINGRVIIYPHAGPKELTFVDSWNAAKEKNLFKTGRDV